MNHHSIFMSRERKKSLFTEQRAVLRPDQLASLKTQHSTFLQPSIYQQSNALAAHSDDLDHIQQIERVQVSRKSRLLEQAAQLLFQRMKIKRLLQIAHHPSLQRLVPGGGRAKSRHHNQAGLLTMGTYPLEQFKAVGARHFQIANNHVILFCPEYAYGFCPIHHPTDKVTILAQRVNNAPVEVLFVLNYENTPLIRHSCHRLIRGVDALRPIWDALIPSFFQERVSFSRDKNRKGNHYFRAEPLITGNSHHAPVIPDDAAHNRES